MLIKPSIRGARRDRILTALRRGQDLTAFVDTLDDNDHPLAHLARVIEYEVPDRAGNGSGELIVHHAISALTRPGLRGRRPRPDQLSFAKALRLIRRTATGTADISP